MRSLPLLALLLAMTACAHNPTIPDPRFEMPAAPTALQTPPEPLKPIVVPE